MLQSAQLLHILEAEAQHLVTVAITLPAEVKGDFERRLADAFSADAYTDAGRAWNAERLRVVQETLDQHLLPAAVKWTREWIREEEEESLCRQCAYSLREVSIAFFRTIYLAHQRSSASTSLLGEISETIISDQGRLQPS